MNRNMQRSKTGIRGLDEVLSGGLISQQLPRSEEQLTMLPASEVELGETTRKVLEAIERSRPSRLVVDSLSEYRLLAQSTQ